MKALISLVLAAPALVFAQAQMSAPTTPVVAAGVPATSLITSFIPPPNNWFGQPSAPAGDVAPTITTQPNAAQAVATGATVTLSVVATGTPAPQYQWFRNFRPIRGATSASYTITGTTLSDAGVYTVALGNPAGFVLSNPAVLSVYVASAFSAAPSGIEGAIQAPSSSGASAPQNAPITVSSGDSITLTPTGTGSGLSYQWQFNDQTIAGATTSSLTIGTLGATDTGAFSVEISNGSGLVAVEEGEITVVTNSRLLNLSVFGQVETGDEPITTGFEIGGTGSKSIVLRGVGPTLSSLFGMTGVLTGTELTLFGQDAKTLATNSAWGSSGLTNAIFATLGAFPLATGSSDSAIQSTLSPGAYSAELSGASGATGTGLVELYDADTAASPTATLVNVSGRGYVSNGSLQVGDKSTGNAAYPMIAGIVISGPTADTVLLRGVGPGLKAYGIPNATSATTLTLYNSSGGVVTANAGWGGDPTITAAGNLVGAFPLTVGSNDSALLVTLQPGSYTVQVSAASGASSGDALVEVYEVK